MDYVFNSERYALRKCQLKVESLFINDIHKNTGIYVFPMHKHEDFLEISLIIEGTELVEFINEGSYKAGQGDIIIKNANSLHQEAANESKDLVELSIGISGVHIDGLPENTLIPDYMIPVIHAGEDIGVLKELFYAIHRMYKLGVVTNAETIHLALKTLVSMVLLTSDKNGQMKKSEKKVKLSNQIEEVLTYIDKNFSKQISLDDIARTFFVSPYHLARQFKAETGYTVNQYIQQRRLGMAEQRLAFEQTSIKKIACECGYSNLKYFYSVFKNKTGHTPNEFRNLIQE
mgnify:CR=1 FL=1